MAGRAVSACTRCVRTADSILVDVSSAEPVGSLVVDPAAARGGAGRRIADLPGPRGIPLLGNALQLDLAHFHTTLERWAAVHGPIYQLRLGPRQAIVVADRLAADRALRARPGTFRRLSTFESVAAELGMIGVFTAEGEAWRPLRTLAMEALAPSRLRGFYPILETVAERIGRRWARAASSGDIVDVTADFTRFTVDVTTWLAFGRDVNTVEGKHDVIEQRLGLIFPMFHRRVVATIPYWRLVRLPADRRFERALKDLRAWLSDVIAKTAAELEATPARAAAPANFLEAMLAGRDEAGRPFSDAALFGSAMTMLIAGQDTTANALAWTTHYLCETPAAFTRVRDEVDAVLGHSRVPASLERAHALTYTAAALNEAMRLRPVVPLLYLEANADTIVDDITVPRGTPVFLLTRPSMRDGRFDAPDEFRPERWLDAERAALAHDPTAHIPFGSGPRLCPGRSLATLEARVAIATLVRSFDLERVGGPVRERYSALMVPDGLSVRLHPRG